MENKNIAICLSTFNRPKVFKNTLEQHRKYLPPNAPLIVVEDAHTKCLPYVDNPDYSFTQRAGIPKVKNKCLDLAMDSGATDIFLFDDDSYPTDHDWHLPYVNGEYKHMCDIWKFRIKYSTAGHNFHEMTNGHMMYIHRSVVTRIGGFDESFGLGTYEHNHYSTRAHACGLIPHPYISPRCDRKIFCMDETENVERTFSKREKNDLLKQGARHYDKTKNSLEFINYRTI